MEHTVDEGSAGAGGRSAWRQSRAMRLPTWSCLLLLACARNVADGSIDEPPPEEEPTGTGGASGTGGTATSGTGGAPGVRDSGAPRDIATVESTPEPITPGCGPASLVTAAFLDAIFPPASRHAVYTHAGFLQAAKAFPRFLTAGSLEVCKKEAAAFLANVAQESGRLRYVEEINKDRYCSSRADCPCEAGTGDQSKWYYGRGAMQLSWNYNYCAASVALGVDLRAQPSQVSTSPELAWKTAIWFWMTQRGGGSNTCHLSMTEGGGFGETIRTINGGIECNKGGYGAQPGVTERVKAYLDYAKRLGITTPGAPTDNDC
jgi:predicted chitinase